MKSTENQKPLREAFASKGLYDDSSGKEQEAKILHAFLQRLQLGHYRVVLSERPDFFLNFALNGQSVCVGCEVTYYFADNGRHGSAQARFVRQWKRFAKSLRVALDKEGKKYKHLYGAIHFNNPNFKIMDRFDNSAFISEIVFAVKNAKNKHHIKRFNKDTLPLLREHVDHVYLKDTTPETGILWWPSHLQSGKISDSTNKLIKIIKEKNVSAHSYDWVNADEKWLLIYGAAEGIADMMVIEHDPAIHDKLGGLRFDRVYIWDKFFERIYQIYPQFLNVFSAVSRVLYRKNYPPAVRSFILSPNKVT
ncbi:MAG: hypothetical protein FD156_156 [Nitrospirae bacterium]|nr:MAG: hypothetical protein FD156_156 [Nitrospirota bacterium]